MKKCKLYATSKNTKQIREQYISFLSYISLLVTTTTLTRTWTTMIALVVILSVVTASSIQVSCNLSEFLPASICLLFISQYSHICVSFVDVPSIIGQLPRVSTEDRDRVVSVFEFHLVLFLFVSKFSHFLYYKVL